MDLRRTIPRSSEHARFVILRQAKKIIVYNYTNILQYAYIAA